MIIARVRADFNTTKKAPMSEFSDGAFLSITKILVDQNDLVGGTLRGVVKDRDGMADPLGRGAAFAFARLNAGGGTAEARGILRRGNIACTLDCRGKILGHLIAADHKVHGFVPVKNGRQTVAGAVDIDDLAAFGNEIGRASCRERV